MTIHAGWPVGTRVAITGRSYGSVVAVVARNCAPEDLSDLDLEGLALEFVPEGPAPPARLFLFWRIALEACMRGMGVDRLVLLVLIQHPSATFWALHSALDDCWRDLEACELVIVEAA